MGFDLLGQIFGKARRRRLEAQAAQILGQAKPTLISLAAQSIDAMPKNSAPDALRSIAQVLVGEALTDSAVKDLVPATLQNTVQGAALTAIAALPQNLPLNDFQSAAKAAVTAAITKI